MIGRIVKRNNYTNVCIVVAALILALLTFVVLYHHIGDSKHTSVILLKLPRSGSSWLTESLNNEKEIFISKEILQRDDANAVVDNNIESHLRNALKVPTGTIILVPPCTN